MNQHSIQKAYLKAFEDTSGRIWVYRKSGGRSIPKPASDCTAEEDFQPAELEFYQQKFVETPASKALRATGLWSDLEYEQISAWMALHIIRNKKSRAEFFESPEDYSKRFHEELRKELLFSNYYRFVFIHRCKEGHFLQTSDNPIVEFTVGDDLVRCFAKSPEILILFSPRNEAPKFEAGIEDFFNAMVWENAYEYVYSHRKDVSIERFKELAETFRMSAVAENLGFYISPQNYNYVSAVFSTLIEPITELYTLMLGRCGSVEPNQVQTSPAENGYAMSIIALTTFLLEGACGRASCVSGLGQRRSPWDTLRDLGATDLADRIEEVFVVRDVIAHSHLWTANVSWDENGLQFQGEPGRLPAYGDKKFERLVDPHSRTTRQLKLDVFPPRIHGRTAITALKECVKALQFLESKDRRFVYLTPIYVRMGGDEIPFYKWVKELPA